MNHKDTHCIGMGIGIGIKSSAFWFHQSLCISSGYGFFPFALWYYLILIWARFFCCSPSLDFDSLWTVIMHNVTCICVNDCPLIICAKALIFMAEWFLMGIWTLNISPVVINIYMDMKTAQIQRIFWAARCQLLFYSFRKHSRKKNHTWNYQRSSHTLPLVNVNHKIEVIQYLMTALHFAHNRAYMLLHSILMLMTMTMPISMPMCQWIEPSAMNFGAKWKAKPKRKSVTLWEWPIEGIMTRFWTEIEK